jgi:hypothetical protein
MKNKQSPTAEVESKASAEIAPAERFEKIMKPLEDTYLWWHTLAETGKIPKVPPKPLRYKDSVEDVIKAKSTIILSAEDYLGGIPKRYENYAALENEMFPDLFREVFEDDILSLYEAIASSKAAGLYSNLMTAKLQQHEQEKKKQLRALTGKAQQSKESLAGYMVDIVTKYLLAAKESEKQSSEGPQKKKIGTKQTNDTKKVIKIKKSTKDDDSSKESPSPKGNKKNEKK